MNERLKMYKSQFRKWGISKYMKASEKEEYIEAIRESGHHMHSNSNHPELGVDKLRKITRHLKMQQRDPSRSTRKKYTRGKAAQITQVLKLPVDNANIVNQHSGMTPMATSSGSATNQLFTQSPILTGKFYRSGFIHTADQGSVDMYKLLNSVRSACTFHSPTPVSDAGHPFWTQVKHAIYLFRIGSHTRAWSALNEACENADQALQTIPGLTFTKEALAILSPSNTRSCWDIRQHLIKYLGSMARIDLGEEHPITIVLLQLTRDSGTREISERGLQAISDLCGSSCDETKRAIALDARLSTSRLLRKDKEYGQALDAASQAHECARNIFGSGSRQALSALREQEHILIDAEEFHKALEVCFSILKETGLDARSDSPKHPFGPVIHTMEDISQIYEELGDNHSRNFWLHQAAGSAKALWGETIATTHIMDKLYGTVA